jgi:hypothetical protein
VALAKCTFSAPPQFLDAQLPQKKLHHNYRTEERENPDLAKMHHGFHTFCCQQGDNADSAAIYYWAWPGAGRPIS